MSNHLLPRAIFRANRQYSVNASQQSIHKKTKPHTLYAQPPLKTIKAVTPDKEAVPDPSGPAE